MNVTVAAVRVSRHQLDKERAEVTATLTRPEPAKVAQRAREILDAMQQDPEFERLRTGCAMYSKDWDDFYGYPIVVDYDAIGDAPALFVETIRALALKSAVYELTGDERLAELPVSVPVDTMSHAIMAQFTLLSRMQDRTGIRFVHMTDMEEGEGGGTWDFGDYTHQCYRKAFGPVNERFWIGAEETERRRQILDGLYAGIGITDRGKKVAISFETAA